MKNLSRLVLMMCLVSVSACTYSTSKRMQQAVDPAGAQQDQSQPGGPPAASDGEPVDHPAGSVSLVYRDEDGDGFGVNRESVEKPEGESLEGYSAQAGDCNDKRRDIHPGVFETPGDGEDQNCDGVLVSLPGYISFHSQDRREEVSGWLTLSVRLQTGDIRLSGAYRENGVGEAPGPQKDFMATGLYASEGFSLSMVVTSDGEAGRSEVFQCTYDTAGRLRNKIDRVFQNGQLKKDNKTSYTYDAETGHLKSSLTDRNRSGENLPSVTKEWIYDENDFLIGETVSEQDREPVTHESVRRYDEAGRLVSLEKGGDTYTYSYDEQGRVVGESQVSLQGGAPEQERHWTYDEQGRIISFEKRSDHELMTVTLSDYVDLPFEIYPLVVDNDFIEEILP